MTDVILAWSGGKDSTLALHEVVQAGEFRVVALLTSVTRDVDRISIHGVRRSLLEAQVAALGIPLHTVELSANSSNEEYRARMTEGLAPFRARGIDTVVHGDIFLVDVRAYRDELLAGAGMRGAYPLWGRDTGELAERFVELGYQAVLTCVDTERLDAAFAGRAYDRALLRELPPEVDACGENGEFHTFVWSGGLLAREVEHRHGETVVRDGRFAYRDLLPHPPQ
jgi:uncharacterized protein (TIGR00290 family)